jgi:hypothetical protein
MGYLSRDRLASLFMEVDHRGSPRRRCDRSHRYGWRPYPWIALPLVFAAMIVIHPVMDKELPNLIDTDTLRSPRTYIAVVLLIAAQLVAMQYEIAFLSRFVNLPRLYPR